MNFNRAKYVCQARFLGMSLAFCLAISFTATLEQAHARGLHLEAFFDDLRYSATKRVCIPSNNSCDYYLCQEQNYSCGLDGYLLSFGYNQCQSFLADVQTQYSSYGQQWLEKVRYCLQTEFEVDAELNSCQSLEERAHDHHISCYKKTNFCALAFSDKIRIYLKLLATGIDADHIFTGFKIIGSCFSKRQLAQMAAVRQVYEQAKFQNGFISVEDILWVYRLQFGDNAFTQD